MDPNKKFIEQWSAIAPGDLGLKAAIWTDPEKKGVTFRPIVGWITYTYRELNAPPDVVPRNNFAPVVIGDDWVPTLLSFVPDYAGIVPKDLGEEQVIDRLRQWAAGGAAQEPLAVNVRDVGKA
jgi:hypothetical protein